MSSGQVMLIERTALGKKFGELGGTGGWESHQMSLEIKDQSVAHPPAKWQERWVPMLIDQDAQSKEWFIVATFYTCTDWYDLGRPKLPYVEYRYRQGKWQQLPLNQQLSGRVANLLTGPRADGESALVTIEDIRLRNDRAAPKFKKILSTWNTSC